MVDGIEWNGPIFDENAVDLLQSETLRFRIQEPYFQ